MTEPTRTTSVILDQPRRERVADEMPEGFLAAGNLIAGFREDLATDRIYRLMLASRIRHRVTTEEGVPISGEKVGILFEEELEKILAEHRDDPEFQAVQERYRRVRALSEGMSRRSEFSRKGDPES